MRKNQFLKVKNSLLELENYIIELKDSKLEDREVKIKRKKDKLFLNQLLCLQTIWISLNKKELDKIKPIKNAWYDCLVDYIPELKRKRVRGFKDFFQINTPKKKHVWERKETKQNKETKQKQ